MESTGKKNYLRPLSSMIIAKPIFTKLILVQHLL